MPSNVVNITTVAGSNNQSYDPLNAVGFIACNIIRDKSGPAIPIVYDVDAAAFFAEVVISGGTLTDTSKNAFNAWCIAAKANGYWNLLKLLIPCIGSVNGPGPVQIPGLLPQGATVGTPTQFSAYNNYSASDAIGIRFDGISSYLDTNQYPATLLASQNDCCVVAYTANFIGIAGKMNYLFGCSDASTTVFAAAVDYGLAGTSYQDLCDRGTGRVTMVDAYADGGLYMFVRSTSNHADTYQGNSVIGSLQSLGTSTGTSIGGLPAAHTLIVGGSNEVGFTTAFTGVDLRFFIVMTHPTSGTMRNAIYNDMQTYQTALSRQV